MSSCALECTNLLTIAVVDDDSLLVPVILDCRNYLGLGSLVLLLDFNKFARSNATFHLTTLQIGPTVAT